MWLYTDEYTKTTSGKIKKNRTDLLKQGETKNQALELGDFTKDSVTQVFCLHRKQSL